MRLRSLIVAACAAFPAPLAAQVEAALRASVGVHDQGDHVLLTGPGYTARVDGDGLEFTPLSGPAVDRPVSLRATPVAISRGAVTVWARGGAAPERSVDGARLRRSHGAGVTEVYDARAGGVEQSFELAERPAGTGDLVVRVVVATGLPCVEARPDGLRYERTGLGGVTIGAVTGIDSKGQRAAGTLRRDGDLVEYVLPAAFVDAATYPLLVDPLFGPAFLIGDTAATPDEAPDVAFDATNQVFCVVWRVAFGLGSAQIRAQRVTATGTLVGGQILVYGGQAVEGIAPKVAGINATDRFLVVWAEKLAGGSTGDVLARSIAAASGALSNVVTAVPQSATYPGLVAIAVGGDSRPGVLGVPRSACIAFLTTSGVTDQGDVHARRIDVPSSSDPVSVGSNVTLSTGIYLPAGLAITRHAGSAGRWLISWTRGPFGGPHTEVAGRVLGTDFTPCTATLQLAAASGLEGSSVATADGSSFAVAWRELTQAGIGVRHLAWTGVCGSGGLTPGPVHYTVALLPLGTVSAPVIEFAANKYVLAYQEDAVLTWTRIVARSLDPANCAACGNYYELESPAPAPLRPAICAQWSGASNQGDMTLVAWDAGGAIRARRFEATGGGAVAALGGACGTAGGNVPAANGPSVLGNLSFALSLGTPTAPVLAAIVGLSAPSLGCGPCVLVPNLDIVMAGPGPHPIPIPCDVSWIGVQFWTQWLLFAPGGCPLLPDFALSAAHRYTITD